jgi:two-component system, NarL family, nitrate/nitrite response regulator NarL
MTLRVLLVSAMRVVREALHSVLARESEVDVVGTVDLSQAKEQLAQLDPDVILFDAGRQDGVDLVKDLVASAPRSKVVAFGVNETAEEILALAAAGTAGYIGDSVKSGDVVKALQRVISDELTCSPRAAALLYRRVGTLSQRNSALARHTAHSLASDHSQALASSQAAAGDHGQTDMMPLSRRELQIAPLIDRGLTNKEIARQLGIEAATVKNHIHNICRKLNVHRRGEATARMRAILAEQSVTVPESLPAPNRAADQNPAARGGNHVGHPWTDIVQLGGVAIASVPSELKSPMVKL